jgi:hypothetical protein
MQRLSILRPTLLKLIVTFITVLLTLFVVSQRTATSKVSWNESRGAPLPFLNLVEYQGPCPPVSFCTEVQVNSLQLLPLLIDILIW